jgi:hypothetical protein
MTKQEKIEKLIFEALPVIHYEGEVRNLAAKIAKIPSGRKSSSGGGARSLSFDLSRL